MVGTFGLASVFSFYATKMICSGEGGAVASNSEDILQEIRDIRDYDKKSQYRLRYNYKMTEMQAAMARVQLRKLPAFIARRRQIASVYDQVLEPLPFKIFKRAEGDIYYRYFVACDNIQLALERFRAEGVWVSRPVSIAIHQLLGLSGYPGTEKIYKHALSIPCYPALLDIEMEYICKVIKKVASSL
jgi:dTDP-4-amino-4,6-dideoxygalactose transaminase